MSVAEQKKNVRTCACVHACARVSLWVCARAASRSGVQVHMRVRRRVGGRRCVCAMTVRSANVAAGVAILKLEFCFKAQTPHCEANDAARALSDDLSKSQLYFPFNILCALSLIRSLSRNVSTRLQSRKCPLVN